MHIYAYNLFANTQVQPATSQQLLVVELLQFHNMYNAEIRQNKYCCCDTNNKMCTPLLGGLEQISCERKCDTWFNISLSPCESAYLCSAATAAQCDSDPVHNLDFKFEFAMRTNSSDTVSVNKLHLITLIPCYKAFKVLKKLRGLVQTIRGNHNVIVTLSFILLPPQRHSVTI